MLYASKTVISVKTSDREGVLGAIEQSTLPLQNTVGVSLLLVLLWGGLGAIAYHYWQLQKTRQLLKIERLKTNELGKKLKLALHTIDENERNPDLINSRDFNLDYLIID